MRNNYPKTPRKKRIGGIAFAVFGIPVIILSILGSAPKAYAADPTGGITSAKGSEFGITATTRAEDITYNAEWLDAGHLKVQVGVNGTYNGKFVIFVPNNSEGGSDPLVDQHNEDNDGLRMHVEGWGGAGNCHSWAGADVNGSINYHTIGNIGIDLDFNVVDNEGCKDFGGDVKVDTVNPDMSIAYFRWVDSAHIEPVAGMHIDEVGGNVDADAHDIDPLFEQDGGATSDTFLATRDREASGGVGCVDRVVVSADKKTLKFYDLMASDKDSEGGKIGACGYKNDRSIEYFGGDEITVPGIDQVTFIAGVANSTLPPGKGTAQDPTGKGDSESTDRGPSCSTGGGALGWILCPVLALLDETTQQMEDGIRDFLFVDTSQFTTDSGVYKAWSTFRGLATIIIVIIALIMIFSQAMGDGIFDNYSVKKILPRLVIAGIGIQLSWFLLVALVDIFNVLGNGISNLMLSGFDLSTDTNLRDVIGPILEKASVADAFAGAGFAALVIAAPALMGGFVALGIGVLAAVVIGLITLIVRDMIILVGVILAPIAIAMSVLPGTQKTSKWWWESLEKALLMYPFVMAMLASGKIIAMLLFESALVGAEGQPKEVKMTYVIAGIIAWYLPFFFLPKALQAGGQALGKITGFAGDKTKGMFDKARGLNDTYRKGKKARTQTNAFDEKRDRTGLRSYRNLTDAKTRAGSYLAAGAIGRGAKFERGNLQVKGAQESMQRRLFDKNTALTELQVKEAQVAADRAFTNANIDAMGDKGSRQSLYSQLALLQDGAPIEINGTKFEGSWAVREKALGAMLKNKMLDSADIKDESGAVIGTAMGLSDGRGGGVFAELASRSAGPGGATELANSLNSFKNSNFGDVKALMPDQVGDGPDKWTTFGAEKLEALDKTRKKLWREQVVASLSSTDPVIRGKAEQDLYKQVNDLAKNGKDKEFADLLVEDLKTAGGGVHSALGDKVEKAILSRGGQRIDSSGTLV